MCHAAVSKCCYSYSWQRCYAAVSKCYRKRLNRFWELATCHAAVSICYRNRSGELARIFWTWQCAEAAARHQGWMRRAMQQFRNVIERRFGSWHGVLGLGKMLHGLFFRSWQAVKLHRGVSRGETRSSVEMLYIETELWKPAKSFGT